MLQRPKDLADPGLAGMCSYKDMLDVLRLWRSGLQIVVWSVVSALALFVLIHEGADTELRTLILVAPLTDFSKELAIVLACRQRSVAWCAHVCRSVRKKKRWAVAQKESVGREGVRRVGIVPSRRLGRRERIAAVEAAGSAGMTRPRC